MQKLSKEDRQEFDRLVKLLQAREEAVDAAVGDFNDRLAAMITELEGVVESYNEAIREANEFRENIYTDMNCFFEEKSEKWQEGENGDKYSSWMNEWVGELEESSFTPPDDVEVTTDAVSAFADLPGEP